MGKLDAGRRKQLSQKTIDLLWKVDPNLYPAMLAFMEEVEESEEFSAKLAPLEAKTDLHELCLSQSALSASVVVALAKVGNVRGVTIQLQNHRGGETKNGDAQSYAVHWQLMETDGTPHATPPDGDGGAGVRLGANGVMKVNNGDLNGIIKAGPTGLIDLELHHAGATDDMHLELMLCDLRIVLSKVIAT